MKLLLMLVISLRLHFRVESSALSFAAITIVGNKSSEATRACIGTILVWVTLIDEMRSGGVLAWADLCARKSLLNLHWIYVKRPLRLSLPRCYTLASQPIVTTIRWNVNVDFIFCQWTFALVASLPASLILLSTYRHFHLYITCGWRGARQWMKLRFISVTIFHKEYFLYYIVIYTADVGSLPFHKMLNIFDSDYRILNLNN